MPILSQVDKKGGIEIFELLGEALKKQKIKI
jgi:hypothetical protein